VAGIQDRTHALVERSASALTDMLDAIVAAQKSGATPDQLAPALALQRKAQWRLDFVAAENSMGFHAPAETARILAESIDFSRQAQLAAGGRPAAPPPRRPRSGLGLNGTRRRRPPRSSRGRSGRGK